MRWRLMTQADLPAVIGIAAEVHPAYPEGMRVFAERLSLYPAGCHVLVDADDLLTGYVMSHPWMFKQPPALNAQLGRLPDAATTYYLHDIALLSRARGGGYANGMARTIVYEARALGFPHVSLVAVNNSEPFWAKHGFRIVADPTLDAALRSYDESACLMVREL